MGPWRLDFPLDGERVAYRALHVVQGKRLVETFGVGDKLAICEQVGGDVGPPRSEAFQPGDAEIVAQGRHEPALRRAQVLVVMALAREALGRDVVRRQLQRTCED